GLGGGPGKLRISLAGMDIPQIEARSRMEDREVDTAARRSVPDIQIAAPLALSIQAGGDLSIRRDSQGSDKGSDRPAEARIEMDLSRPQAAVGAGSMAEDPGGVVCGEFRPAGGFS